ncbi:cytochrome b [bacterium SCSIO 12696]|nr:cytochrome b [bacterium SCSIO 12696]
MQADTRQQLSKTTISLHWVVAILMIGLLSTGVYMEQTSSYWLYDWHKSFGVVIALFVVARIIWRIKQGWPQHVGSYTALEILLAKLVHYLLIVGTLVMPVSGFLMSAMGGHGVAVFGFELFHHNPDPNNPGRVLPINPGLASTAHSIHWIAGYCIIAGVVLHVAGAVKHHVADKDGTLRRMLGKRV